MAWVTLIETQCTSEFPVIVRLWPPRYTSLSRSIEPLHRTIGCAVASIAGWILDQTFSRKNGPDKASGAPLVPERSFVSRLNDMSPSRLSFGETNSSMCEMTGQNQGSASRDQFLRFVDAADFVPLGLTRLPGIRSVTRGIGTGSCNWTMLSYGKQRSLIEYAWSLCCRTRGILRFRGVMVWTTLHSITWNILPSVKTSRIATTVFPKYHPFHRHMLQSFSKLLRP